MFIFFKVPYVCENELYSCHETQGQMTCFQQLLESIDDSVYVWGMKLDYNDLNAGYDIYKLWGPTKIILNSFPASSVL